MSVSWGRLPIAPAQRSIDRDWRFSPLPDLAPADTFLAHGCGRSYGDSCINSGATELGTTTLRRYLSFDEQTGLLECEAGLTLNDILQLIVPKGWFLPVVPGTRYVTLGGAIANDVHGKNHHTAGSFGCHVRSITLLRSDGSRPNCSEQQNSGLFAATIGGLGLTGLITSAQVQLIPMVSDAMETENLPFSSIAEFCQLNLESAEWAYNVSWIDTLARKGEVGRGIFTRARHVQEGGSLEPGRSTPTLSVPITPPISLVNRLSVDLFNRSYFMAGVAKKGVKRVHYQSFLFPLDAIANWNKMYGRRGFFQYQCVIPREGGKETLEKLLHQINSYRDASFLVVLKEFGDMRSPGFLSFPRPGFTLALDFPNRGEKTLRMLSAFDETVAEVGGALYPAKDARMPETLFSSGYPGLDKFREQLDTGFSSAFWRRVQK